MKARKRRNRDAPIGMATDRNTSDSEGSCCAVRQPAEVWFIVGGTPHWSWSSNRSVSPGRVTRAESSTFGTHAAGQVPVRMAGGRGKG